eukprot:gene9801-11450_t
MNKFAKSLLQCLKTNEVIPNVLPATFNPVISLQGAFNTTFENNQELAATITNAQKPTVTYTADSNQYYTMIMTDPDAPTRSDPKYGQWLHWLVVNIPGSEIVKGDTMAEFIGSGPPEGSGLHRYVFILAKQPSSIVFKGEYKLPVIADKRNNWSAASFIEKWNLEPVGCTFYQAKFDASVPTLYKTLEDNGKTCKPQLIEGMKLFSDSWKKQGASQ